MSTAGRAVTELAGLVRMPTASHTGEPFDSQAFHDFLAAVAVPAGSSKVYDAPWRAEPALVSC